MSEASVVKDGKTTLARGLPAASQSRKFDRNLVARAESRLQKSGYPALRDIRCESQEGVFVLRGHVPSYYLKQVAQELVRGVATAETIVNQVEVGVQEAS